MRVLVRGAGIIGLAVAGELIARGHDVTVVDPAPASGAWFAAAGMLTPACEADWGERTLLELCVRGAALWPGYASRLGIDLCPAGTLLVGHDRGDLQQVERQAELLADLDHPVDALSAREVRRREPTVGRVAGGVALDDSAVDPRAVVAALRARIPVLARTQGPEPDVEVLATGTTLPAPFAGLVRGVRGEVLRVLSDDPPTHVVRGWVRGEPVYAVPRRRNGTHAEVVIGATSEEHDAPPVVTVGGVGRLLDAARVLLPGLDRARWAEATARDRPASPDHLPLIGPAPRSCDTTHRVVLAAGHHRHGVLLAPLSAELVADHLDTGRIEPALDPRRFAARLSPPPSPPDAASPPSPPSPFPDPARRRVGPAPEPTRIGGER